MEQSPSRQTLNHYGQRLRDTRSIAWLLKAALIESQRSLDVDKHPAATYYFPIMDSERQLRVTKTRFLIINLLILLPLTAIHCTQPQPAFTPTAESKPSTAGSPTAGATSTPGAPPQVPTATPTPVPTPTEILTSVPTPTGPPIPEPTQTPTPASAESLPLA